jgi:hypothetical protein
VVLGGFETKNSSRLFVRDAEGVDEDLEEVFDRSITRGAQVILHVTKRTIGERSRATALHVGEDPQDDSLIVFELGCTQLDV